MVDNADGEAVAALQLAQEGEQRRYFAAEVLVDETRLQPLPRPQIRPAFGRIGRRGDEVAPAGPFPGSGRSAAVIAASRARIG
jgi:hypothetical protein